MLILYRRMASTPNSTIVSLTHSDQDQRTLSLRLNTQRNSFEGFAGGILSGVGFSNAKTERKYKKLFQGR